MVCDYLWDDKDATVVCRQLGFKSGVARIRKDGFGQGTGKEWLDDVNCTGYEMSLADCKHAGIGVARCYYHAGVQCKGMYIFTDKESHSSCFILQIKGIRRGLVVMMPGSQAVSSQVWVSAGSPSGLAWLLYKCAAWGGLSMVLLQLKEPLELFVKRREFLADSEFLSRRDMT